MTCRSEARSRQTCGKSALSALSSVSSYTKAEPYYLKLGCTSRLRDSCSECTKEMDDELTVDFLGDVNNASKQKLGQVLWNWSFCGDCVGRKSCAQQNCPWSRSHSLSTQWDLYKRMTDAYSPERLGRRPALSSHDTLFIVIQKIRDQQTLPRKTLLRECFEGNGESDDKPPTLNDQNRAFNIAASILLLMDFGVLHDPANSSDGSTSSKYWRDGLSMSDFISETFPRNLTSDNAENKLASLTALQLKKVGKLRLKATNDIRRHLMLDQEDRVRWQRHEYYHNVVLTS